MKNWLGLGLAAATLAASVSAGFACEQHAAAAKPQDAKETKDAKQATDTKNLAASGHAAGCDMPCCAQEKTDGDKPCAAQDAKGCPKKAATATAAKAEPAKDTAQAQPAPDPGTHR